jgi:branched-subunit amino acid transport protein
MILVLILIIGALTFLERFSFIALAGRVDLPQPVRHALRYLPAAVISALVLPSLVYRGGEYNLSPLNPRLLAALIAALVAWRTRNAVITLIVGMAALWLLQAVLP